MENMINLNIGTMMKISMVKQISITLNILSTTNIFTSQSNSSPLFIFLDDEFKSPIILSPRLSNEVNKKQKSIYFLFFKNTYTIIFTLLKSYLL